MKLPHVIGGLFGQSCMALRARASATRGATLCHAVLSGFCVQKCMAARDVVAVGTQRRNRAGGQAGLQGAAVARPLSGGQFDRKRQRQRPPKRHPEPGFSVYEHPHRALPHTARRQCPALEWRVVRAIGGKERAAAKFDRERAEDPPGPAIHRMWGAVAPFGGLAEAAPPVRATLGADQNKGLSVSRAKIRIG